LAIEVKMSTQPSYRDIGGLSKFLRDYPDAVGGVLIHGGTMIKRFDENIVAIPWTELTG
jgi:hypothetical protein